MSCGILLTSLVLSWCNVSTLDNSNPPYMTQQQLIAQEKRVYEQKVYDLAVALYFEERSRRVSDECVAAIGYVILNRVKSKHYPDTVYGTIWQPYQFSFTHDGKSEEMKETRAKKRALLLADKVLRYEIDNVVGDSDHYLNKDISRATWWNTMESRGKCGNHWFYKR